MANRRQLEKERAQKKKKYTKGLRAEEHQAVQESLNKAAEAEGGEEPSLEIGIADVPADEIEKYTGGDESLSESPFVKLTLNGM